MSVLTMEDLTQGIEQSPIFGPSHANSFEYVKTNIPGPGFDIDLFLEEFQGCLCAANCLIDSCQCVDLFGPAYHKGMLLKDVFCSYQPVRSIFECGKNCLCTVETCTNRLVQKGIHKDTYLEVIMTGDKGYGLITNKKVLSGTFVCEYAGEVVNEIVARERLHECEKHRKMNFLIAIKEKSSLSQSRFFIDPKLKGNIGRFINHSCNPNLIMIPVRVNHSIPRLALFSCRDVSKGEELTFDYSGNSYFERSIQKQREAQTRNDILLENDQYRSYYFQRLTQVKQKAVEHSAVPSLLTLSSRAVEECTNIFSKVKKRKFHSECKNPPARNSDKIKPSMLLLSDGSKRLRQDMALGLKVENKGNYSNSECLDEARKTSDRNVRFNNIWTEQHKGGRKECLCKSINCNGFLPFDGQLFDMGS